MPLLYNWYGYLFRWVGAFCVREADNFVLHSDMGVTYPFHFPSILFGLACHDPVSVIGHIPLWVHYPPAVNGYRHRPSALCMCSFQSMLPYHLTCGLHLSSVDTPVDVHMYKPQLPIFPPQGSFTGRSCQVTALPFFLLWHPLFITSDRGSLAYGGAGTPVPCMMAAHTQGNAEL